MSDERRTFGDFWDAILEDDALSELPGDMTFSPVSVALARTVSGETLTRVEGTEADERRSSDATVPGLSSLPALDPRADGADIELIDVLGEGGMGVVHRARQHSLGRDVAVKALHPGTPPSDLVRALLQEACLAGALEHPNVVPIHALGRDGDERPLLVMKRVEGHTWSDLLDDAAHGGWSETARWSGDPLQRNLTILLEVCDAVQFAHSRGVLHRDLKPANVMVGPFGEVYVMDWGLAVKEGEGPYQPSGSLHYMAPEMIDGGATKQTDVYLLGAILHQILTGTRLHRGPRLAMLMHCAHSPSRDYDASVPAELAAACNRATAKDPADRFPTVRAFRRALTDYLQHRGSIQLADAAEESLRQAQEALAEPTPDRARVGRRFAESRFGFQQALKEWPENEPAQTGLKECLDGLMEWELEHGSAASAGVLLEERRALDPEPAAQLAALEARIVARRSKTARLEKMASELDASVSSRERTLFFGGIVALMVPLLTLLYTALDRGWIVRDHLILVALPVFGLTVIGIVTAIFRKTLLANTFNRRIMATLVLLVLGIFFHRVVCWNLGLTFEQILATDLVLLTVVAAVSGLTISRWLWLLGTFTGVGALVASLVPSFALEILVTAACLTAISGGVLLVHLTRNEPPR